MGYDLHIERTGTDRDSEPTAIPLEDWKAALSLTEGVRLLRDRTALSIATRDGDAEVLWVDDGQWRPAFSWSRGSVKFSGHLEPGDRAHPVWAAAVGLATRLGAVIRGDEGEIYDLETGHVVDA
jgi:hypothetical protein